MNIELLRNVLRVDRTNRKLIGQIYYISIKDKSYTFQTDGWTNPKYRIVSLKKKSCTN